MKVSLLVMHCLYLLPAPVSLYKAKNSEYNFCYQSVKGGILWITPPRVPPAKSLSRPSFHSEDLLTGSIQLSPPLGVVLYREFSEQVQFLGDVSHAHVDGVSVHDLSR